MANVCIYIPRWEGIMHGEILLMDVARGWPARLICRYECNTSIATHVICHPINGLPGLSLNHLTLHWSHNLWRS